MKTILVDAWNTFVTKDGMNQEMFEMLENFENTKIILTNANEEEKIKLGIVNMPYEVFSLSHNPDKTDSSYFQKLFEHFGLSSDDIIYFEHNQDAVKSAESKGIKTFHYDKEKKDIKSLQEFLKSNV